MRRCFFHGKEYILKLNLKTIKVPSVFTKEEKRELVLSCDRDLEERMEAVARRVASSPNLKFIGLTGPTCSGKTTAAHKLTQILEESGKEVHVVSIDDFYYDTSYLHARVANDPDVEIDFDSEDTIDIDLLREKIESLLACKETQMPRFDFHTGKRVLGELITPKENDVFLFEGIQILYPKVRALLQGERYTSIYICPLSSLEVGDQRFEPNEIRLMRRLVRDAIYRSSTVAFSLKLWQSVRKNEEINIFPYSHTCGEYLDSTMAYEIGMLKPHLEELLRSYPPDGTYVGTVNEILKKIRAVEPISSSYISQNSLYKEFI